MLITVSIILLALSVNAYLNLKDFIRVYKESTTERVFAQVRELKVMIDDVTELGLGLGELKGLNKECQRMVETIPYARYCFVMDNHGKAYYHNFSGNVGSIYTDSITQNALKAGKKIVQDSRLDSGEEIYDFSIPVRDLTGEQIGLVRVGILSEIINKEVFRLRNRAITSGIFFIIVAGTLVCFVARFGILNPIKSLMVGIAKFGKGQFDSRIELKTRDEIGQLANSFNQMAEDLQKTTVSRDALAQEVTERKRAQEKLKEAMEIKSKFTSMVSHELRTPLTAIKEGIGIVLDGSAGEINEDQLDFLDTAKRNVDRLHRLINEILDFAKLESGKVEFKMEENSINGAIKEVIEVQKPVAEGKGLYLKTELASDVGEIKFDYDKIIQVLTNLTNNALKFVEKGGITVGSAQGDRVIRVTVKDTGIGIKEEDIPQVFQDFQQVGVDKFRKPGSTGLGLAICREIVEAHGGKIWVESKYGVGTDFIFTLPMQQEG